MTIDEQIAVLTAWKEGKTIEFRGQDSTGAWLEMVRPEKYTPLWDFGMFNYRVKHEPRRVWIVSDSSGLVKTVRNNESDARTYVLINDPSWTVAEFVEVLK